MTNDDVPSPGWAAAPNGGLIVGSGARQIMHREFIIALLMARSAESSASSSVGFADGTPAAGEPPTRFGSSECTSTVACCSELPAGVDR
jgi:hypothetical protein